VKRLTPKAVLSIFCCSALMSGASMPSVAQVVRVNAGAAGALGAGASAASALQNPALNGGVPSIMGANALTAAPLAAPLSAPGLPAGVLPAVAPAAAPAAALAAPALPAAALPAASDAPEAPKGPKAAQSPAEAAKSLASELTPAAGETAGGAKAAAASGEFFDGSDGGGDGAAVPTASNGAPLSRLYPKVVFLQDVFSGPAPESVAESVNQLIDAGVHVVFLTWRPQKGPGSADEVLLSRVKQSRNNPVVVVSYNGGKISLHGRAANPKPILENVGQFTPANLEKIRGFAEKIAANAGGRAVLTASPDDKEAFSLTVAFEGAPKLTRGAALRSLNTRMRNAGLPYKAQPHPELADAVILHSMPLRFSLPRVLDALDGQFPGENLSAQPEKFLVIADSMKSPKFSTSFPKKAEVQVAGGAAGADAVLGAVLGMRRLETVSIKLGKLRQYAEYWEPSRRYASAGVDSEVRGGGGGGSAVLAKDRKSSQMMSMFVGTVINRLMARIYENIRNGQHQFAATPWAIQKQLEAMWRKPIENGVYVNKKLAAVLATIPPHVKRGYFEKAAAFVSNFYARELASYPAAAAHVEMNLVSLNTDRKSSITLEFKSNATGKIYKIYTRIPRVMMQRTGQGVTLTAYAYRTGKETADDGEEFLARVFAMALLKAHARKGPDGLWHQGSVGGAPISKLVVQFERHTSARIKVYDAKDFDALDETGLIDGPVVREITSAIERMEADAEYQQYYLEHEQEATKDDLKKPRKKAARRKPAAKTAAAKTKKTGAK
jgi:hypothetical protein